MQGVKSVTKQAFMKSIPIMCSYIFVSMAYGMMMENAGFAWYYSLLTSLTVYTGAFQFVLITFLSSGASIVTIAVTALLMNSRQSFYSLSFLETFRKMGRKKFYMIHTMTDETYAVNCTIEDKDENSRKEMFLVAFFSRCYWMFGAVMGGLIWNDPDIGVEWPIPEGMELTLSDKDKKWGSFAEFTESRNK